MLRFAAAFLLNVLAWQAATGRVPWAAVLLAQAPVTVGVIWAQIASGTRALARLLKPLLRED